MEIDKFLVALGINNHPGLKVKKSLDGYRDFTFGCKAGPVEPNVDDLSHELAHAAQFGAKNFRHRAFGFRFKVPRVFVYDRYCVEPTTNQGTLRELETFAYQLRLQELAGMTFDKTEWAKDHVSSMKYMPDFWFIVGDTEEEKLKWCADKVLEFVEQISSKDAITRLVRWLDATHRHFLKTA